MFLFLKNIAEINIDISSANKIEIVREGNKRISLKKDDILETEWLTKKITLFVSQDLKETLADEQNLPDKLKNANEIELTLAARNGDEGIIKLSTHDRLLYSYLPTDETRYSFPVLVNTSFLTTSNRESLHAISKWNQWLFKNIALEIFKWIAELVISDYAYQAYRLVPNPTTTDNELGKEYNKGIDEAINTIPFIITTENTLAKVKDIIVDLTYLSEKEFIGESSIKNFIDKKSLNRNLKFAKNTGFSSVFMKIGASSFKWSDIHSFLLSKSFTNSHTIQKNIEFIKHLKYLCESEKISDISTKTIRGLPFILDHKNDLKYPSQVCFPTPEDQNWNNPESELSFLNQDIQIWLLKEPAMRIWLESIGMIERTDVTYIIQTIIPNIDNYITIENAIYTQKNLFNLYRKGDLKEDLLCQLSRIKLLTQKGSLLAAKECYLSDFYNPRSKFEEVLEFDIYVSELYCQRNIDKDEWKRFFKILGVQEGVSIITESEKQSNSELIKKGYKVEYLNADDKKFKPAISTFSTDSFKNTSIVSYLQYTENNPKFAFYFWTDFLQNYFPENINTPAIAFWGYDGRAGQRSGDEVGNYIPWVIKNIECIPVISEECKIASSVLLNSSEIKAISGKYLPVFNGPELSADWKSFLNFRTILELSDYLELLSKISLDINDKERVKKENVERIQTIYSALLNQSANWSVDDISIIEEWASNEHLLNTKKQFTKCSSLKYFFDGNESIFQEQFDFLYLSAENRKHSSLDDFLVYFKITILKQSDFKLYYTKEEECSSLKKHLEAIIPYFRIWIENETNDDNTKESLDGLEVSITGLNIYQAEELKIKYEEIDFTKSVNVHFNWPNLFLTTPWDTNSVLLKLPEVLCRYFYLLGHDKKLDFLLRSNIDEIQKYFLQESIDIPASLQESTLNGDNHIVLQNQGSQTASQEYKSFVEIEEVIKDGTIAPEFFHISKSEYESLKCVQQLISRAVTNIVEHLRNLPN